MNEIFKKIFSDLNRDLGSIIEISEDFISQMERELPILSKLTINGQYHEARKIAHKLKGSVLNFHLPIMLQEFLNIESFLILENDKMALDTIDKIYTQLNFFRTHLEDLKVLT